MRVFPEDVRSLFLLCLVHYCLYAIRQLSLSTIWLLKVFRNSSRHAFVYLLLVLLIEVRLRFITYAHKNRVFYEVGWWFARQHGALSIKRDINPIILQLKVQNRGGIVQFSLFYSILQFHG